MRKTKKETQNCSHGNCVERYARSGKLRLKSQQTTVRRREGKESRWDWQSSSS